MNAGSGICGDTRNASEASKLSTYTCATLEPPTSTFVETDENRISCLYVAPCAAPGPQKKSFAQGPLFTQVEALRSSSCAPAGSKYPDRGHGWGAEPIAQNMPSGQRVQFANELDMSGASGKSSGHATQALARSRYVPRGHPSVGLRDGAEVTGLAEGAREGDIEGSTEGEREGRRVGLREGAETAGAREGAWLGERVGGFVDPARLTTGRLSPIKFWSKLPRDCKSS
jgi:hypothetical protein